jgi:ABC-type polysaccharide/polyol phosphate export permease
MRNRYGVRDLWRFRHLLRTLIARDLKVKYQRSLLGFVWTFLNPLLTAAILIAVFRVVFRIRMEHYWAFLLSGFFAWNATQQMLSSASYTLQSHSGLVRSVAFPKEILLFGAALSRLVEFGAELVLILVVLAVAHHHGVPVGYLFLPLLVAFLILLATGFMLPIAAASTLYSDVQHTLPVVLTSLFYLSPVFYAADMVPEAMRPYYFLNPFAGLITLFHQAAYEGRVPDTGLLLGTAAASLFVFLAGSLLFRRYRDICNEIV